MLKVQMSPYLTHPSVFITIVGVAITFTGYALVEVWTSSLASSKPWGTFLAIIKFTVIVFLSMSIDSFNESFQYFHITGSP